MLDQYELITLKTGTKSLRCLKHQETFHPGVGPLEEARTLHVAQQDLVGRANRPGPYVIWDVGLGAAANAIAAIESLIDCPADVEVHSFDRSISSMEFALAHAEELKYLVPYVNQISQLLSKGEVQVGPRLKWFLHTGDFRSEMMKSVYPSPQSVFYDPYSPVGNHEMWTLEHFKRFLDRLDPNVPCLLTNYSRSTAVRVTLLMAGFFVGVGRSIGEKLETTIFSNKLELLENPLRKDWLNRVKASGNGGPLRGEFHQKGPVQMTDLRELERHPQLFG